MLGGSGLAGLRILVSSLSVSESDSMSARATSSAESARAMLSGRGMFWPDPVKTSMVTFVTVVLRVRTVMAGSEKVEKVSVRYQ